MSYEEETTDYRARIRELEVELAQTKDVMYGMDIGYHATVDGQKALVAELEAWLVKYFRWTRSEGPWPGPPEDLVKIEAREREEC